jgi:aryl-alcohol dehydrogenase-like predicted oxidoreductase
VPIPGTKRRTYLEENARAAEVKLTAADLKTLNEIAPMGIAAGRRYPERAMKAVNR